SSSHHHSAIYTLSLHDALPISITIFEAVIDLGLERTLVIFVQNAVEVVIVIGAAVFVFKPVLVFREVRTSVFDIQDTVPVIVLRSEEHTSELQSRENLVCSLLR